MMYDLHLYANRKEEAITSLNTESMDELRLFACGIAIGTSVKYKHVKVRAYERDSKKLVFETRLNK